MPPLICGETVQQAPKCLCEALARNDLRQSFRDGIRVQLVGGVFLAEVAEDYADPVLRLGAAAQEREQVFLLVDDMGPEVLAQETQYRGDTLLVASPVVSDTVDHPAKRALPEMLGEDVIERRRKLFGRRRRRQRHKGHVPCLFPLVHRLSPTGRADRPRRSARCL